MTTTTVFSEDATTIMSEERRFNWGAAIAGAIGATAVTFFLLTLGSGIGLALVSPTQTSTGGTTTFFTLGAIYFLVAQGFGFAVGGYLVGRLIGPEVESTEEEEFRAAAHGFVMWAVAVVASLLLVGFLSAAGGSTISAGAGANRASAAAPADYWLDLLFRPAPNTPAVLADKAEVGRILASTIPQGGRANDADSTRMVGLVSRDAGISMPEAMARLADVQTRMHQTAGVLSLWTAFALLFGAIVAVAAAISSRWMDDRITFSLAPRR